MRFIYVFLIFTFLGDILNAQDSIYARRVIKFLTSKKCYGRGYLNNGLDAAASFISKELASQKVKPLFSTGYYQWFDFNVNTFPGRMSVKINNWRVKPGEDFIVSPESKGVKGKFRLQKKDSVTYVAENSPTPLVMSLKKKLTFSVAQEVSDYCAIELLNKKSYGDVNTIEVDIEHKLLTKYINKNICGFIPGSTNSDSLIMFSAHYDHLGGMGKETFFPGANDNASGVSALLNLIAYYTKHPPKYKTLFLFFAGEEAGLMGSHYFAESKAVDLKKIKFLINLDLLGTGDDGIMVVNGALHEKEFTLLNVVNSEKQLVKEIKKRGKAKNSDHYWFSEAGVPCFFIYTLGGVASYHDVFDVEKTLPLTDYEDVITLLIDFANAL